MDPRLLRFSHTAWHRLAEVWALNPRLVICWRGRKDHLADGAYLVSLLISLQELPTCVHLYISLAVWSWCIVLPSLRHRCIFSDRTSFLLQDIGSVALPVLTAPSDRAKGLSGEGLS